MTTDSTPDYPTKVLTVRLVVKDPTLSLEEVVEEVMDAEGLKDLSDMTTILSENYLVDGRLSRDPHPRPNDLSFSRRPRGYDPYIRTMDPPRRSSRYENPPPKVDPLAAAVERAAQKAAEMKERDDGQV